MSCFPITCFTDIIKIIRVIPGKNLENSANPEAGARNAATQVEVPGLTKACGRR